MKKIKIGLLGFGTVGQGVWKILNSNMDEIISKCGYEIEIKKILVKDINKKRCVDVPKEILTTNSDDIFYDEEIKIIVELIGGAHPAKEYIIKAAECKKHIVTANKLVVASFADEIFKAVNENNVMIYYEASVGGGIPIIKGINESLTANKIKEITGIVNGTTNYILTKMTDEGLEFEEALKQAQNLGYAEADPTSDVEGFDAVYKLAIMASLSFNTSVDINSIYREGIGRIKAVDIEYAKRFGYVIKLLAIAKEEDNLELRVHPAMVEKNHPIANVGDSFNAIFIKGNAVGDLLLCGRGAGDLPTGSAVVSDIISIIRNNFDVPYNFNYEVNSSKMPIKQSKEFISKYYIRLDVKDQAGVLGQIANIFGQHNISILSVTQDVFAEHKVNLVFVTHDAKYGNIVDSLEKIKTLNSVNGIENVIRIYEFN
ncbi:homoserine dehydrogenase [Caloramator quimbayensis]|uniref:Homoserine dehydrogenase n=1 Tax=Caloramator quimbayensis TaxID=1147123 RepID=A0A1T4XHB9_9CLOT|nr:homoserine dehydrogenase [Caloramator quimbayensis]SKA88904.1 homoserine dehydrogenase [Caloramator quimbayensis]